MTISLITTLDGERKPLRICRSCGHEAFNQKDLKSFKKDSRAPYDRRNMCKKCINKLSKEYYRNNPHLQKEYYKKQRTTVIDKLGGKCAHCGFSDVRALQIDHIHGGGIKEIRKIGNAKIERNILGMSIIEMKRKYQLLCANCNWIKRYKNNEVRKTE